MKLKLKRLKKTVRKAHEARPSWIFSEKSADIMNTLLASSGAKIVSDLKIGARVVSTSDSRQLFKMNYGDHRDIPRNALVWVLGIFYLDEYCNIDFFSMLDLQTV